MPKRFIIIVCIVFSVFSFCGCQSSSLSIDSETKSSFTLDSTFSFQGVTIPGSAKWEISQPKEYNYYLKMNDGVNSRIDITTALYGQTDTLTNAWHEFTTAESDPIKDESWENNAVTYSAGNWTNNAGMTFYMISGFEASSGKGFLVTISLSPDTWNEADAKALYTAIKESITYNPSETTMDYKEAFNSRSGNTETKNVLESSRPSESASQTKIANYKAGSYRVGTDITSGEYKILCSGSHGYFCVYPDTAKSEILENGNFTTCTYVTVSDGQLLEVKGATFVSIEDAQPTSNLSGQGVYKIGLDIAPGEYNLIATDNKGYYAILSTVDASIKHNIIDNDNFEGNSFVVVSNDQYLEISRASIGV